MRALTGLWRWRRNPLRRRTDLVESWVALVSVLLALVAAPVAGSLVGSAARSTLQRSVQEERRDRHPVTATVVRRLDRFAVEPDPDTSSGQEARSRVVADWRAVDGSRHRGPATSELRAPRPGDRFPLWTDGRGRVAARPLEPATATAHAVLAGCGAAALAAGLIECIRRLAVGILVRRRYARWDHDWDRAGPDWGLTGAGS
ncbi:Rv1733c family protein [Streptomyces tropicalis]|uniref:Uncharacterized protein n=1 Tax=Streptomyces tropicalis TaxID=3034234 RepID=A0ABT6A652_9ACTN|nr:hypothetical protein [Streptomyces tropicalis]MDF3299300.1 hypothetical protein [Streptomyces tropicalis]